MFSLDLKLKSSGQMSSEKWKKQDKPGKQLKSKLRKMIIKTDCLMGQ